MSPTLLAFRLPLLLYSLVCLNYSGIMLSLNLINIKRATEGMPTMHYDQSVCSTKERPKVDSVIICTAKVQYTL